MVYEGKVLWNLVGKYLDILSAKEVKINQVYGLECGGCRVLSSCSLESVKDKLKYNLTLETQAS